MTGRTHDLCAFTALNIVVATMPLPPLTIGTAFAAVVGALIGGIIPDLDQHTSDAWDHLPGGSIYAKILSPFMGGHRSLSHSLLGLAISGGVIYVIIQLLSTFMIIDVGVVWAATMIGQLSHLVSDTFTTAGVPWFLPIKTKFGIPPMKFLRVKVGGFRENIVIYPGLILFNTYLIAAYYPTYQALFLQLSGK